MSNVSDNKLYLQGKWNSKPLTNRWREGEGGFLSRAICVREDVYGPHVWTTSGDDGLLLPSEHHFHSPAWASGMLNSLHYELIKESATERLYSFSFFIFIAYFMVLDGTCHFSRYFYYELHCPLNLEVVLRLLLWNSKGNFRQWETQLRPSPGPCHCPRWAHAHHHLEIGSSNPPPQTLDRYSLTDRDLSFSNCPGLESEQNLRHPGKGSWMGRTSCSRCSPEECWLCCCLR